MTAATYREWGPGLYYTTHTVHNHPEILDKLTEGLTLQPEKGSTPVTFALDQPDYLLDNYLMASEDRDIPSLKPPLLLSGQTFERHSVQVSSKGSEVHTFHIPYATLSLPDVYSGLPKYTRVHAVLQVITEGKKGELIAMDSVDRTEYGVYRDQRWAYVRGAGGQPEVYLYGTDNELDSYVFEELSAEQMVQEMEESVGRDADRRSGDRLLDDGEKIRATNEAWWDARRKWSREYNDRVMRESAEIMAKRKAAEAAKISSSDKGTSPRGKVIRMVTYLSRGIDAPSTEAAAAITGNPVPDRAPVDQPASSSQPSAPPFAPTVPSPLRNSITLPDSSAETLVDSEPLVPNANSVPNGPSSSTTRPSATNTVPSTSVSKTVYPQTIAIADPNNSYEPRLVVKQPHISDSDSEIDELDSSSDSEDEVLVSRPSSPSANASVPFVPTTRALEKKKAVAARKKNLVVSRRMTLRSGKRTGACCQPSFTALRKLTIASLYKASPPSLPTSL